MTPSQASFYRLLRLTLSPAVKDAFQIQVSGLGNLPRKGGALVVCNHRSVVDPFLLGAALPRPVNFMAASFVFKMPVISTLAERSGAIPVHLSGGKKAEPAIAAVVRCLRQGQVVGIFPEGVASFRKGAEGIARFQMGFVRALAAAGMPELPVVPCAIVGQGERAVAELPPALMGLLDRSDQFKGATTEIRLPRKVWIGIGKPLILGQLLGDQPDKDHLHAATEAVRAQVHQLYENGAQAIGAEPPPQILFEIGPVQVRVGRLRHEGPSSCLPDLGQGEALLASYQGAWDREPPGSPRPHAVDDWLLISDRKITLWRPPATGLPLAWDQVARIRTRNTELVIVDRHGHEHRFRPDEPEALAAAKAAIAEALRATLSPEAEAMETALWERDRRR